MLNMNINKTIYAFIIFFALATFSNYVCAELPLDDMDFNFEDSEPVIEQEAPKKELNILDVQSVKQSAAQSVSPDDSILDMILKDTELLAMALIVCAVIAIGVLYFYFKKVKRLVDKAQVSKDLAEKHLYNMQEGQDSSKDLERKIVAILESEIDAIIEKKLDAIDKQLSRGGSVSVGSEPKKEKSVSKKPEKRAKPEPGDKKKKGLLDGDDELVDLSVMDAPADNKELKFKDDGPKKKAAKKAAPAPVEEEIEEDDLSEIADSDGGDEDGGLDELESILLEDDEPSDEDGAKEEGGDELDDLDMLVSEDKEGDFLHGADDNDDDDDDVSDLDGILALEDEDDAETEAVKSKPKTGTSLLPEEDEDDDDDDLMDALSMISEEDESGEDSKKKTLNNGEIGLDDLDIASPDEKEEAGQEAEDDDGLGDLLADDSENEQDLTTIEDPGKPQADADAEAEDDLDLDDILAGEDEDGAGANEEDIGDLLSLDDESTTGVADELPILEDNTETKSDDGEELNLDDILTEGDDEDAESETDELGDLLAEETGDDKISESESEKDSEGADLLEELAVEDSGGATDGESESIELPAEDVLIEEEPAESVAGDDLLIPEESSTDGESESIELSAEDVLIEEEPAESVAGDDLLIPEESSTDGESESIELSAEDVLIEEEPAESVAGDDLLIPEESSTDGESDSIELSAEDILIEEEPDESEEEVVELDESGELIEELSAESDASEDLLIPEELQSDDAFMDEASAVIDEIAVSVDENGDTVEKEPAQEVDDSAEELLIPEESLSTSEDVPVPLEAIEGDVLIEEDGIVSEENVVDAGESEDLIEALPTEGGGTESDELLIPEGAEEEEIIATVESPAEPELVSTQLIDKEDSKDEEPATSEESSEVNDESHDFKGGAEIPANLKASKAGALTAVYDKDKVSLADLLRKKRGKKP